MTSKLTRNEIVQAADRLFYEQGYEHTSFSDIAHAVSISRGNFYYHFKTKDEILGSVITLRMTNTKKLIQEWESKARNPAECIKSYIRILNVNWEKIRYFGCPVGTICNELSKLNHSLQGDANQIFSLFLEWLISKFVLLGCVENANEYALRVLSWSQGVATIANAFQDRKFARSEVKRMCDWVESLRKD